MLLFRSIFDAIGRWLRGGIDRETLEQIEREADLVLGRLSSLSDDEAERLAWLLLEHRTAEITVVPQPSPSVSSPIPLPPGISRLFQKCREVRVGLSCIGVDCVARSQIDPTLVIIGDSESGEMGVRGGSEALYSTSFGSVEHEPFCPSIFHWIVIEMEIAHGIAADLEYPTRSVVDTDTRAQ